MNGAQDGGAPRASERLVSRALIALVSICLGATSGMAVTKINVGDELRVIHKHLGAIDARLSAAEQDRSGLRRDIERLLPR